MPYLRLFLGFVALGVSFYFSMIFITASTTGAGFIAAIAFVVVTEFTKSIYTSDIVYFSKTGQGDKAAFCGMVVAVLFALSISASIYFLISSPAKDYTKLDNATSKLTDLEKSIQAKRAQINACPHNYLTKCINPRTAELNALEASKRNALINQGDFSGIQANREFWRKTGEMLGMTGDELEMYFALIRGVILEVLGLALIAQGMVTFRLKSHNAMRNEMRIGTQSPSQSDQLDTLQQQLNALLEKKL